MSLPYYQLKVQHMAHKLAWVVPPLGSDPEELSAYVSTLRRACAEIRSVAAEPGRSLAEQVAYAALLVKLNRLILEANITRAGWKRTP